MKIEKIKKLKSGNYKIIIDGEELTTCDNVIINNNLLYKKNIDNILYKKIITDTKYYDVYNKTVKYILKKRRSEKEISKYLEKYEISISDKINIINKLKEINLINDLEYCKAYINDRLYLSKDGINKIRIDLLNQNIQSNIIDKELNNVDNEILDNRLEKMILKKINSNYKYSNRHLKEKILNDMIMLGYQKEKILNIIDNNLNNSDEIIKKEYIKLYNKLSKKYNGEELLLKIKQKLLYKGFESNKINEIIKKTED